MGLEGCDYSRQQMAVHTLPETMSKQSQMHRLQQGERKEKSRTDQQKEKKMEHKIIADAATNRNS